jgi:hypothetical protein
VTRRKQHPNPIVNVTFSLIDTRARVRLCYHYNRLILIGVQHVRPVSGGLGWERMLQYEGRRWREMLKIAGA